MQERSAYLTLSGLPLTFEFQWPFHKSTSGADFWVLHGVAYLEDGSGLRSDFSIHLTQTMHPMMPGMDSDTALPYVINVVRRMVDTKDLEFLRSGKRQPIDLSSRFKNFKTGGWRFGAATDDEVRELLRQSGYWIGVKLGRERFSLADETNALYAGVTKEHLSSIAKKLESEDWLRLEGELAVATEKTKSDAAEFEKLEQENLAKLQQKHAFESAHKM
ncbi:MAG TPA: hypothetical protein VFU86_13405 [Terriglobales bacterium]|nr:hypothetical protein [Terriglobales bacterium]